MGKRKKEKLCSICGGPLEKKYNEKGVMYWDDGNNAEPVNSGRCCDVCNGSIVIPTRIKEFYLRSKGKA